MTTTVLQNVQDLAVAQKMEAPADSSKLIQNDIKAVTLLVSPNQAALLDLGMSRGTLHLALRNPGDAREARTRPATMNDLQFHQEKPLSFLSSLLPALQFRGEKPLAGQPEPAAKPQSESTNYAEIRTLRGLDAGTVRIAFVNGKTTTDPSLPADEQRRLAAVKAEVR